MASIRAAILSKGKSNPFNPVKSVMKAPTDKLAHRLQVFTYTSLEKRGWKAIRNTNYLDYGLVTLSMKRLLRFTRAE